MNTTIVLSDARAHYPNSTEIDLQQCPKGYVVLRTRGNGTIIIHNFTNKTRNGKNECIGNYNLMRAELSSPLKTIDGITIITKL